VTAPIVLETPVALQAGDVFAITEGGREVGSGKIVSVDD
jgi:translation elongation factor EF-Tu-like GTPase